MIKKGSEYIMKNKKGFTMIEIIVCISIMIVIGVGSFIGIRLVDKHIKTTKLQQMSDKILQAANVYLETDKEANKELYTNKNGVIIPVRKLVNEGLIDVGNINLNDKTDYVIALLGSEDSNSKCTGVYTATEWDLGSGKTIYICTDSKGNSNLATIDPTKYNNKTYVSNEPYYYKGIAPQNWIDVSNVIKKWKYSGAEERKVWMQYSTLARIITIDSDDTILVVINDSIHSLDNYKVKDVTLKSSIQVDYYATVDTTYTNYNDGSSYIRSYSWFYMDSIGRNFQYCFGVSVCYEDERIITKLPDTCKIKAGTGASWNPYKVEC